jgi:hypothetical protein
LLENIQIPTLSLLLAVLALILMVGAIWGFRPEKRARYRPRFADRSFFGFGITDPAQQLHCVMRAHFEKQKILSRPEYSVFKVIEDDLADTNYRVFAQTCLGEILKSSDQAAFRSINSKRVDMLVVDWTGLPTVAIEYQGNGHYQGTAAARDAVKKEALRKAGVQYIEISDGETAEQIRYRLHEALGRRAPSRHSAA